MKILAIETSCDDTGIAILEVSKAGAFNVLSNIVSSQVKVHKKYGGVYPALAKREHQKNLTPAFKLALTEAGILGNPKSQLPIPKQIPNSKIQKLKQILEREPELAKKLIPFLQKYEKPDIGLIAVTNGPGLEPCLWVGVNFAKALSYFWDIPVVPVNHIESHILVNFLREPGEERCNKCATAQLLQRNEKTFPAIALVVSGGHTQLILMKAPPSAKASARQVGKYKILGETRDDAAGECFDKCAKILGLPYPGGPEIAKLASGVIASESADERGNPGVRVPTLDSRFRGNDIILPRPMLNTKDYDFSFSGLKTAVLYSWDKIKNDIETDDRQFRCKKIEMAAEIQQAIIDVLLKKTIKAAKDFRAKTIILGGGVSANKELKKQFKKAIENELCGFLPYGKKPHTINFLVPPANLSTDNALMTAVTGYFHRNKKIVSSGLTKLKAEANLRISK